MKKAKQFFQKKRPWSLMKDRILGWYLKPYLTKVSKLGKPTVVVDGFAGCGLYDDGSEGSPLIICKRLEERAASVGAKAVGIFIEADKTCFNELRKNIGKFEDALLAVPLFGDFKEIASQIIERATDLPMFFYIDPFGIKGLEFEHLVKIFQKVMRDSTEVLVNFNYKAFLREAKAYPELARAVMGGDYFEGILDNPGLSETEKENRIVQLYKDRYNQYFNYVGSFPVVYKGDRSKYHLVFATSHFDGLRLMNDGMGDILRDFYTSGRLFPDLPPEMSRDMDYLEEEIMNIFRTRMVVNRHQIKQALIPKLLLRYKEGDYGKIIEKLLREEKVFSETGKTRINDRTPLSLGRF